MAYYFTTLSWAFVYLQWATPHIALASDMTWHWHGSISGRSSSCSINNTACGNEDVVSACNMLYSFGVWIALLCLVMLLVDELV